jgi:hypothetical protein
MIDDAFDGFQISTSSVCVEITLVGWAALSVVASRLTKIQSGSARKGRRGQQHVHSHTVAAVVFALIKRGGEGRALLVCPLTYYYLKNDDLIAPVHPRRPRTLRTLSIA